MLPVRPAACAAALLGTTLVAFATEPPHPSSPADHAEPVYRAGDVTVADPWTRATPKGAKTAGGYMRLSNQGRMPDRLLGGSLEGAEGFEIHETRMEEGVMRMRPLAQGLPIAPGATVELRPGGLHVMFTGLTAPLAAGGRVKGTLRFERAGTVAVEYRVAPLGASAPHRGH
jgi:copper(I)-binding protein